MRRLILIAALLWPASVAAQDLAIAGGWCSDEIMFIEDSGIGFNDHTVCDWASPPIAKSGAYATTLSCKNVRIFEGKESVEPLKPLKMSIILLNKDELAVHFADDPAGSIWQRC